jgi:hypothetical protein
MNPVTLASHLITPVTVANRLVRDFLYVTLLMTKGEQAAEPFRRTDERDEVIAHLWLVNQDMKGRLETAMAEIARFEAQDAKRTANW